MQGNLGLAGNLNSNSQKAITWSHSSPAKICWLLRLEWSNIFDHVVQSVLVHFFVVSILRSTHHTNIGVHLRKVCQLGPKPCNLDVLNNLSCIAVGSSYRNSMVYLESNRICLLQDGCGSCPHIWNCWAGIIHPVYYNLILFLQWIVDPSLSALKGDNACQLRYVPLLSLHNLSQLFSILQKASIAKLSFCCRHRN